MNQQPTKTEAIKNFLNASTWPDLAGLYNHNMECQVNVAKDNGTRIDGDYKGKKWSGWTDGLTTWKSFRIPYKANSDPEYSDSIITFDLANHVEAIGMTGWDWYNKKSLWVAFDFDAIIGHSRKGLSNEQLLEIIKITSNIDWITIRKSTSGKGLHLYVFLDEVSTQNHTEHAALARAILGKLSAITKYDFNSKVDACGGNMWIWHRKMIGTDGLKVIKEGNTLLDIPINWLDHLNVIKGKSKRNLPHFLPELDLSNFDALCSQKAKIPLDDEHKKLINYLDNKNLIWWWDQDHHILVTHTSSLASAHSDLELKGIFKTLAKGSDINDYNCFCHPMRNGAWVIRRFTLGVSEEDTWEQDAAGWTKCYFNKEVTLPIAARTYGGIEDPSGGFVFKEAELAIKAATLLGVSISIPIFLNSRRSRLKQHKDGRLIIEIEHWPEDPGDGLQQWLVKKDLWIRIYNNMIENRIVEPEITNYDDFIRHIVTEKSDEGWAIKTEREWRIEPLAHVKLALQAIGHTHKEVAEILGSSVVKCWRLVNKPFQSEYPGDREWNRNAAQMRFLPTQNTDNLKYATWLKILEHCGKNINEDVKNHPWCKDNNILSGADYLKCWVASLFQEPNEPLPYLFFYGPQNSGKSIFHEALSLLLTTGYKRADSALINQSGFNAELLGTIIAVVEEIDVSKNKTAYNRIKDWVTSRDILIHAKGQTPYHIANTTHWIQVSNDYTACPTFPGDTRIIYLYVDALDTIIPKKILLPLLEKEAPDFLAEILNLEIPLSDERLNLPVITTSDKIRAMNINESDLMVFISEQCIPSPGCMIKFSDFYDEFISWLDPNDIQKWSKKRVSAELPTTYPHARLRKTGHFHIGNIWWKNQDVSVNKIEGSYIAQDGYLKEIS